MELNLLMCSSIFYAIDLVEAAKSNELYKKVRHLNKDNIDTCDEKGISLLMWMSMNRNQQMCRILLRLIG